MAEPSERTEWTSSESCSAFSKLFLSCTVDENTRTSLCLWFGEKIICVGKNVMGVGGIELGVIF